MTEEQINQRLKELDAMTGPKPFRPKIPVRDYLQEAEDINTWCRQDKAALIKAGLNWELAEDLPVRIGALKVSEAEWNTDFKQYQDLQSKWGVAVRQAFIFRDKLIHHFFFALRNLRLLPNPQSPIRIPQSFSPNPQSEFRNPKSHSLYCLINCPLISPPG